MFLPILKKIEEISGKKTEENPKAFRIIADHIKASTFLLAAEVEPSNLGRGYILRRLMRRAIRYGKQLGINESFLSKIYSAVLEVYNGFYSEIESKEDFIVRQVQFAHEQIEQEIKMAEEIMESLEKDSLFEILNILDTWHKRLK